jgi:hypothetical protein
VVCLNFVLIHACMNLNSYVLLCFLSIHVYACDIVIYLLYMEKEKTPFCANIGIIMPLLVFKIQCKNSGGVFYFDELSKFYTKNETLFVLSSITIKGEIESASRPLMDFGD